MKKRSFRNFRSALVMFCVMAAMLSTATFAWFSMNDRVTANNMTVTAKSDAVNLQISLENNDNWQDASVDAAVNENLYPVAHDTFSAIGDIDNKTKWYYAYGTALNNGTLKAGTKVNFEASATNFGEYVTTKTFYFRTKDPAAAANLTVKNISIPADTGITVVVKGTDGYVEFDATASNDATVLCNTVDYVANNAASSCAVTVYIYINGNDENVTTNNLNTLTGEVSIEFGVTAQ